MAFVPSSTDWYIESYTFTFFPQPVVIASNCPIEYNAQFEVYFGLSLHLRQFSLPEAMLIAILVYVRIVL